MAGTNQVLGNGFRNRLKDLNLLLTDRVVGIDEENRTSVALDVVNKKTMESVGIVFADSKEPLETIAHRIEER